MAFHTMHDKVRMIQWQVWMVVAKGIFAVLRPGPGACENTSQGQPRHHNKGNRQPPVGTQPSRERIGNQPASVAEGKLGREEGRAILLVARSTHQPTCRRLGETEAGAKHKPQRHQ